MLKGVIDGTFLEGGDAFKCNFKLERVTKARRIVKHLDICNVDDTHSEIEDIKL
jgi:hypothetical protein